MTKYPAGIDNSTSIPIVIDNTSPVRGKTFNYLRDAVLAIENELGIKPSINYGTVRARLDSLESLIDNSVGVSLGQDLGGSNNSPLVIGLQGNPISNVTPTISQMLAWNGVAWAPTDQKDINDILPSPGTNLVGQAILWDGTSYVSSYYAQDDIIPPVTVSLIASLSMVEVGQPIVHPVFSAIYSGPGVVSSVTLKDSDNNSLQTINGTTFSSNFSFTKNTFDGYVDFTLTATQGRFIKSDVARITWGQKTYWGLGTAGQSGSSFITSLSNNVLTDSKFVNFSLTAGVSQKIYFACRSGYGNLIFTIKNVQGGFTKTGTTSVTNSFGFAENYDLYESNSLNLGAVNVLVSDGMELLLVNNLSQINVASLNSVERDATIFGTSIITQGPGVAANKILKTINTSTCDWVNLYPTVIATSVTITATNIPQVIICNTTSGVITVNLPASGLISGLEILIKDTGNANVNNITVNGNGVNIDNAPTFIINTSSGFVRIITNGSKWFIVGKG